MFPDHLLVLVALVAITGRTARSVRSASGVRSGARCVRIGVRCARIAGGARSRPISPWEGAGGERDDWWPPARRQFPETHE